MRVLILDRLPHEVTPVEFAVEELKRSGKRRLPRAPRMLHPTPIVREYTKELRSMVDSLREVTAAKLLPKLEVLSAQVTSQRPKVARGDADDSWAKKYQAILSDVKLEFGRTYTDEELEALAKKTGKSVSYWQRRQLNKVTSRLLDLDVPGYEPWLEPELDAFAVQNVALIKSVPDRFFDQVQHIVLNGFRQGSLAEDISKDIQGRLGVARANADRIARDQVGKLSGQLNGLRQQNLGIEQYTWRTSLDERVRGNPGGKYPDAYPSHWAREGKVFSWDNPPSDGHPGEPINCRCTAEPVIRL